MPALDFIRNQKVKTARKRTETFIRHEGRRPRILVSQMIESSHRQWRHAVAAGYADLGFDVDIGPVSQTPLEAATTAIENDVHVLAVPPTRNAEIIDHLIEALKNNGGDTILVVAGDAIITHTNEKPSGPANTISDPINPVAQTADIAITILDALEQKYSSID